MESPPDMDLVGKSEFKLALSTTDSVRKLPATQPGGSGAVEWIYEPLYIPIK